MPLDWLKPCLESTREWASLKGYDYEFIFDELFDYVPDWVIAKVPEQLVIATDLARLGVLKKRLEERDYDHVVWMDADTLVFDPAGFDVSFPGFEAEGYAVGREVWVQPDSKAGFRAYKKVHNAFLSFTKGNSFLPFYYDSAIRLLKMNQGTVPPQFIGPKLLTALHNVIQCPVNEASGMLSPDLSRSILMPSTPESKQAIDLFVRKSACLPAAANLCSSLNADGSSGLDESSMHALINRLIQDRQRVFLES